MIRIHKTSVQRWAMWSLLGCALALFSLPVCRMAGADGGLITTELNIGFPISSFRTVNTTDAKAAVRIWIDTVGRNRGYDLQGETRIFSDSSELFQSVRDDRLDLVIIKAWDYLEFSGEQLLRPVYIPAGQGDDLDRYLLLVRHDSQISSLADLKGTDIALLLATGANYSRPWLDTLIAGQGLGRSEDFFGSHTVADKVSAAVLPVFFGTLDACVVDRSGFETMKGMNPQVGRQLVALAASPPLVESVICLHAHGVEHEDALVEAMGELDREPRGRQILMVFKIDRLMPYDPVYLESLIALRELVLELVPEESRSENHGEAELNTTAGITNG